MGKAKTCTACTGADKDKPIVGLVIIKDLGSLAAATSRGKPLHAAVRRDEARDTTGR